MPNTWDKVIRWIFEGDKLTECNPENQHFVLEMAQVFLLKKQGYLGSLPNSKSIAFVIGDQSIVRDKQTRSLTVKKDSNKIPWYENLTKPYREDNKNLRKPNIHAEKLTKTDIKNSTKLYIQDVENLKKPEIRSGYSEKRASEIGYQLLQKTTVQNTIQETIIYVSKG